VHLVGLITGIVSHYRNSMGRGQVATTYTSVPFLRQGISTYVRQIQHSW